MIRRLVPLVVALAAALAVASPAAAHSIGSITIIQDCQGYTVYVGFVDFGAGHHLVTTIVADGGAPVVHDETPTGTGQVGPYTGPAAAVVEVSVDAPQDGGHLDSVGHREGTCGQPTPTPSPSPSPTPTPTATATASPSPAPTATPSATPTRTADPTSTPGPTSPPAPSSGLHSPSVTLPPTSTTTPSMPDGSLFDFQMRAFLAATILGFLVLLALTRPRRRTGR